LAHLDLSGARLKSRGTSAVQNWLFSLPFPELKNRAFVETALARFLEPEHVQRKFAAAAVNNCGMAAFQLCQP
jgi:hypothetical protein